jgi:hypothetical protein
MFSEIAREELPENLNVVRFCSARLQAGILELATMPA